jgi:hypothetical protein
MSEKPRGLNPEELFGDLEQDNDEQEGAKPLYEDLSVEKVAREAVAESRFDSETSRTAKAEAEIREMRKEATEGAPESVEVNLSDLEEAGTATESETGEPEAEIEAEEEGAPEGEAKDEEIPIEVTGSAESLRAIGNLYDQLQAKRKAGQELPNSDVQRLLGEMAEQAALDKYGTTEPLDNITDSQGNRVDFWNADNQALKEMADYLAYEDFDGALEMMSRRLKEWVPEFKKIKPAGEQEAPTLEIKIDDRDLANRRRELTPVVEALKEQPDSSVNDSLIAQAFKSTADYLTLGNDRITASLKELSEHLPDQTARGSLEKAKQHVLERLAADYPNVRGNFRKQLEEGDMDSAVRFLANQMKESLPLIIEKAKTHAARAKSADQPAAESPAKGQPRAEAKKTARSDIYGAGTARKETPKKKSLLGRAADRVAGWFGRKAA